MLFATSSRRDWLSGAAAAAFGIIGTTATRDCDSAWAAATLSAPKIKSSKTLCDPSVSVWQNPSNGRTVYLLGTAHISSSSAILAGSLVNEIHPEAVYLELDASRVVRGQYGINTDGTVDGTNGQLLTVPPPTSYDAATIASGDTAATTPAEKKQSSGLRGGALQAGSAAVGGFIKGMYGKMEKAGFQTGEEFTVTVREAQKLGSTIVLGDRDVRETLNRLTEALAATDLNVFFSPDSELEETMKQLAPGSDKVMDLSQQDLADDGFKKEFSEYVETMKAKENVKLLMGELKKLAPEVYTAMVGERDFYMANGIDVLNQFPQIVAVMGIAHVDGVEQNLRNRGWKPVNPRCPKRT